VQGLRQAKALLEEGVLSQEELNKEKAFLALERNAREQKKMEQRAFDAPSEPSGSQRAKDMIRSPPAPAIIPPEPDRVRAVEISVHKPAPAPLPPRACAAGGGAKRKRTGQDGVEMYKHVGNAIEGYKQRQLEKEAQDKLRREEQDRRNKEKTKHHQKLHEVGEGRSDGCCTGGSAAQVVQGTIDLTESPPPSPRAVAARKALRRARVREGGGGGVAKGQMPCTPAEAVISLCSSDEES
jgi:hypothetical protein